MNAPQATCTCGKPIYNIFNTWKHRSFGYNYNGEPVEGLTAYCNESWDAPRCEPEWTQTRHQYNHPDFQDGTQ